MTRTHQQRQTTAPHRPTGADRAQRPHERTRIIHACADAVITHGYGAVTMNLVQQKSGLARDQLYRLFRNKNELLAEVYRRGHHRASAPCSPTSHTTTPRATAPRSTAGRSSTLRETDPASEPGTPAVSSTGSAIDGVRAFAHAAIDLAASDPVVQAMHALEMSPVATTTGLRSIYRVWQHWLVEVLGADPPRANALPSAVEGADRACAAEASGIAGAVVDALAGTIARGRRNGLGGTETATHSVDLMLQSLTPPLHPQHVPENQRAPATP
ncbi:TetR/AcrR family transcriptional regulator [Rhodococcus sp. NPDC057297]|uniref:TetR/AcrR family transcriptional regulator n=1 Tax=Rhodococcus sp. NPDC057297 TaxID=3346090 RepID=UPI00362F8F66